MNQFCKFSLKKIYSLITASFILIAVLQCSTSFAMNSKFFCNALTFQIDTLPKKIIDSLPVKKPIDSLSKSGLFKNFGDSLKPVSDTLNLKISKDTFSAPITYHAEDSAVVDIKGSKMYLYGKTKTQYDDMVITSPNLRLDQSTQIVTAYNLRDSTGAVTELAQFVKGEEKFSSDSLMYNFKTQKGFSKNTITTSGEMFLHGDQVKKVSQNVTFMRDGIVTSCNYDEPHFAFKAKRMKNVQGKVTVTGMVQPEFEGVAFPVYLPFGYFPNKSIRGSGFLPPQFATDEYRGLGLDGFGYYKVFNDYWDTRFTGSLYSYGYWQFGVNPTYRRKYKYSGSLNLSVVHNVTNFKGDPDYSASNFYSIGWSHSMDQKARPGVSFGASVNANSTKYNRSLVGAPRLNYNNTASSSISYSRNWDDKPYSFDLSARHSQNNSQHEITLDLPSISFNLNTIYPFQRKLALGEKKWYEKFGIGYNGSFNNSMAFYDTVKYEGGIIGLLKHLIDTARWSANHSFPISFTLPSLFDGALIISPGISYSQQWSQSSIRYVWNDSTKKVDTNYLKGVFIDQNSSLNLSASTSLYGTYKFKKGNTIRHTMRTSVGVSYTPDLNKNHIRTYQTDSTGKNFLKYHDLTGYQQQNNYQREFGGLTFGIDNVVQMKTKDKKDTTGKEVKRISIIDGFGISGGYNFLKDSNQLSNISLNLRSNLFNKINLSFNSSINPYKPDSNGYDTRYYAWQKGRFSLGRITHSSISMSTQFSSKSRDGENEKSKKQELEERLNDPMQASNRDEMLNYIQKNPSEFVDFNIPWQVSLSYSLNFSNQFNNLKGSFQTEITSNVGFNGSFSLTPKWNFTVDGFYDVKVLKLQNLNFSINRDMHCWQLSINVTPLGYSRQFSFTISPKSNILRDLRINRNRYFQ